MASINVLLSCALTSHLPAVTAAASDRRTATPPLLRRAARLFEIQDGGHLRPFPETPSLGSQKPLQAAAAAAAASGGGGLGPGAARHGSLRRRPHASAPCSGLDHGEPERGGGPRAATGRDEQQQQQESPDHRDAEAEAGLPAHQERPGALHLRRAPAFQHPGVALCRPRP